MSVSARACVPECLYQCVRADENGGEYVCLNVYVCVQASVCKGGWECEWMCVHTSVCDWWGCVCAHVREARVSVYACMCVLSPLTDYGPIRGRDYSVLSPPVPNLKVDTPMLMQMALFHSFDGWKYSIVYMYHIFFVHSSVDGHLCCLGYCI